MYDKKTLWNTARLHRKSPSGNKSSEFCLKSNPWLTYLGELEVYSATVQRLLQKNL